MVSFSSFADGSSVSASRVENGQIIFYAALHDAFNAADGVSAESPDEIMLLADIVLDNPIIIPDGKHIRLVSNADRIIHRGSSLIEYPMFWVKGNNASLGLGKETMQGGIIVDGAYLNTPSVKAKAPLVSVNGLNSKYVMYDKVILQNNYSENDTDGTLTYRNGAGVSVYTDEGSQETQPEFIMKGGIIRGNFNNAQNHIPFGGGVFMRFFGLFTMEGGIIMNNTAYRIGGGVHADVPSASFKKTGGIIYGEDAPEGYRNIAVTGMRESMYYGHAVSIRVESFDDPSYVLYRDDTVGEDDDISYTFFPDGSGGFGEDGYWDSSRKDIQKREMIMLLSITIPAAVASFFIVRKIRRKKAVAASGFSSREKEIFDMLLSNLSVKEIAYTLKLSYSGVNFHVKNIYRKLGVHNRAELLVKFYKER